MYERPLTEHLCSETGGNLRRLLTLISTGTRDDSKATNRNEAREKAEALYADGEGRFGTHESTFGSVLAHENFKQLQLIFEEYKDVSGNTIEQALNHELSGDYLEALLAIGKSYFYYSVTLIIPCYFIMFILHCLRIIVLNLPFLLVKRTDFDNKLLYIVYAWFFYELFELNCSFCLKTRQNSHI